MSGYAISSSGWRAVNGPDDLLAGETYSDTQPAPVALARADEIKAALAVLDAASARPLRAVLVAQAQGAEPGAADVAKLADLEAQAVTLRAELAGLVE